MSKVEKGKTDKGPNAAASGESQTTDDITKKYDD